MPGVRGHRHFEERVFAAGQRGFHIAFEHGSERLLRFPLRMLRRQGFDAVENEECLEIHRLLGPEAAVIVEDGDPLRRGHEVGRTLSGHAFDESDDGAALAGVVPRRQRVGGAGEGGGEGQYANECDGQEVLVAGGFHRFITAKFWVAAG